MRTFFLLSLIFSFIFYVFSFNHSYVIGLISFALTIVALAGATVAELTKSSEKKEISQLKVVK